MDNGIIVLKKDAIPDQPSCTESPSESTSPGLIPCLYDLNIDINSGIENAKQQSVEINKNLKINKIFEIDEIDEIDKIDEIIDVSIKLSKTFDFQL